MAILITTLHNLIIFLLEVRQHLVGGYQVEEDECLNLLIHWLSRTSHPVIEDIHAIVRYFAEPLAIARYLTSLRVIFDTLRLWRIHRAVGQYFTDVLAILHYRAIAVERIDMRNPVSVSVLTHLLKHTSFRIPFSHWVTAVVIEIDHVAIDR